MEFSRQEYWSGWPFLSPVDLPNPGIEPRSPALQADSLPSASPGKWKAKLQIQTVRMAIIKKPTNNKYYRGCGEKGTLPHCWWEYKLVQPLWLSVCAFMLSRFSSVCLYATVAHQALGILQARILERVAMPPPRDLPNPGIEHTSFVSLALAAGFFTTSTTWEAHGYQYGGSLKK